MNISELQKQTHDLALQLAAESKKMAGKVKEFQTLVELADPETMAKLKPLGEKAFLKTQKMKIINDQNNESYQKGLGVAKEVFLILSAFHEYEMQKRIQMFQVDIQETTSLAEALINALPKQNIQ